MEEGQTLCWKVEDGARDYVRGLRVHEGRKMAEGSASPTFLEKMVFLTRSEGGGEKGDPFLRALWGEVGKTGHAVKVDIMPDSKKMSGGT